MKNSEHLFYLVKSMTKAEKRYFKFSENRYSAESTKVAKLFDVIDRMKVYDHEKVKNRMIRHVTNQNLPALKNNLMTSILTSLRNQGIHSDREFELRKQVDFLSVLFEKQLYPIAKKRIIKLRNLAIEIDSFSELVRINEITWKIGIAEGDSTSLRSYVSKFVPHYEEQLELQKILNCFRFIMAQTSILRTIKATPPNQAFPMKKLESLAEHWVLSLEIEKYPIQCQVYYHVFWGYYHGINKNKDVCYFHLKQASILSEELSTDLRQWSSNVYYLLTALYTFRLYKEYEIELDCAVEFINNIPTIKKHSLFEYDFQLRILVARIDRDLVQGNFTDLQLYYPEMEFFYEKYHFRLNNVQKLVFLYNFSYINLGLKNYEKALFWINQILNTASFKRVREDINLYTKILNIAIHFSLGHSNLLPFLVKSTKRYFLANNITNELVIDFLNTCHKMINNQEGVNVSQVEMFVLGWEERKSNPEILAALYYFDILRWLKSFIVDDEIKSVTE